MCPYISDHPWLLGWLHTFYVFLFFVFLHLIYFVVRIHAFPSLSRAKRRYQILESYFPLPGTLVIKRANIRRFTNAPSWIVFQKDVYYDKFISSEPFTNPEEMGNFFNETSRLEKIKFDNRVLVFEDSDFGIFTPLLTFFWPISKVFEIKGPEDVRLMGIDIFDLDNDDSQEIIIYWLTYHGGSGGIFYPLLIKLNDSGDNVCVSFPLLESMKTTDKIKEVPPKLFNVKVNGKINSIKISQIHTDHFWFFQKDPKDQKHKLIFAYAQGDYEFHYGPQSWRVIVYKFQSEQFFIEEGVRPFTIPKADGISLKEMHGYSFVPMGGMLFPMWAESWRNLDTNDQPLNNMRKKSVVFKLVDDHRNN